MSIALATFMALANAPADSTLTTGYIDRIRADVALADRVVLKPSPENGGGTFQVTDAKALKQLARSFDRRSEVRAFDARVGSANYVVVEIYSDADAKQPDQKITILPKDALFSIKGRLYHFRTADGATFRAIMKTISAQKKG